MNKKTYETRMSKRQLFKPRAHSPNAGRITVPEVPDPRQEDDPNSAVGIRDPNPDEPSTTREGQTLKGHSTTLDGEEQRSQS